MGGAALETLQEINGFVETSCFFQLNSNLVSKPHGHGFIETGE